MAFLERIGKRLTDAGQNVAQQTKNFADVAQLNSTIADKEKKVSQLYLSIGQAYYEKHQNDTANEEQQKIDEINVLQAEIFQCREKIKQIKGVVKCPSCGADVPANAAFCNACGAKVERQEPVPEPAGRKCPVCQAIVEGGNAFCVNCGAKLDDNA